MFKVKDIVFISIKGVNMNILKGIVDDIPGILVLRSDNKEGIAKTILVYID